MQEFVAILIAFGFFGLLAYLGHRDKNRRPMHDRPGEIDAEPLRDYRGPGRKGEPFFQVGGVAFLITLVAGFLFSMWFSGLIQPWVDWLVPRSPR